MKMKNLLWFWPIGLVISLYATFVLQHLWNWLVVPTLHVSAISFWTMYGLHLFVLLLTQHGDGGITDEIRWEVAIAMLDACVPCESQKRLNEEIEDYTRRKVASRLTVRVLEYSVTLAIGWGIHTTLH